MDANPFLKNFMKMRQGLKKTDEMTNKFNKMTIDDPGRVSLATIIETKPKPDVVKKYFECMVEELNQN